ncbi:phage tail length tape measure family protein [Lysobacter enzymogenes]|uniref:phage tail length tape measure family protein n=1 Tax=Lysobacter enzymogenes TaxID=69 RepID=UPI001A96F250|nr:phage tail length tape measure family protein [Lysobacter enzymogenes]
MAIAARLDDLPGVTRGAAVDAISEIIRSTRIAGDQLEEVTAAALAWQRATGASVEEDCQELRGAESKPDSSA